MRNFSFRQGYTLLEFMTAIGILLLVISALFITFVSCILMNISNNNLVIAANDAQFVLEQIKGLAYEDILGNYTTPNFTNLGNESVTTTAEVVASGIKEVNVNVTWTERQRSKNFSLSTRFAR
jgi:prepilin-type N-terminal cleavage/methylation domain-containing protein